MKLLHLSAFFLLCTITLHAQKDKTKTQWLTYGDSLYNFTVQYPSNWEFKTPGTNTRFFITSYNETDADNFRDNINCIARKLEQKDFKINSAEEAIKKSLQEKYTDLNFIYSGYTQWNGTEALEMEYTFTNTSNEVAYHIHLLQRMAVVKEVLYTITYTAEAESYQKYIGIVRKVIQSFKVN